jgi:hypothetical protein
VLTQNPEEKELLIRLSIDGLEKTGAWPMTWTILGKTA